MYKYVMLMVVSAHSLVAMQICPPMEQSANSSSAQDPVVDTYDRLFKTYQQKYKDARMNFWQEKNRDKISFSTEEIEEQYRQELAQTLPLLQEEHNYTYRVAQTLWANLDHAAGNSSTSSDGGKTWIQCHDTSYEALLRAQQAVDQLAQSNYARLFLQDLVCKAQLNSYDIASRGVRRAAPYVITSAYVPGIIKNMVNPWLSKPDECDKFVDSYNKFLLVAAYTKAILLLYALPGNKVTDMASQTKAKFTKILRQLPDGSDLYLEPEIVAACNVFHSEKRYPYGYPVPVGTIPVNYYSKTAN